MVNIRFSPPGYGKPMAKYPLRSTLKPGTLKSTQDGTSYLGDMRGDSSKKIKQAETHQLQGVAGSSSQRTRNKRKNTKAKIPKYKKPIKNPSPGFCSFFFFGKTSQVWVKHQESEQMAEFWQATQMDFVAPNPGGDHGRTQHFPGTGARG